MLCRLAGCGGGGGGWQSVRVVHLCVGSAHVPGSPIGFPRSPQPHMQSRAATNPYPGYVCWGSKQTRSRPLAPSLPRPFVYIRGLPHRHHHHLPACLLSTCLLARGMHITVILLWCLLGEFTKRLLYSFIRDVCVYLDSYVLMSSNNAMIKTIPVILN